MVQYCHFMKILLCLQACQSHRQVLQVQEDPVKCKERDWLLRQTNEIIHLQSIMYTNFCTIYNNVYQFQLYANMCLM